MFQIGEAKSMVEIKGSRISVGRDMNLAESQSKIATGYPSKKKESWIAGMIRAILRYAGVKI